MARDYVLALNVGFALYSVAILIWARWRTEPGPAFPGPRPVGRLFKAWLIVIWTVGLLLPLAALAVEWTASTRLALIPYLVTFVFQVMTEIYVWKRWRSPVWVLVPCLHLPWRLFQAWLGLTFVQPAAQPLTHLTLEALVVLWLINIGVHYTNIVNTLRWSAHPRDATFPALKDPRVFVQGAQG